MALFAAMMLPVATWLLPFHPVAPGSLRVAPAFHCYFFSRSAFRRVCFL